MKKELFVDFGVIVPLTFGLFYSNTYLANLNTVILYFLTVLAVLACLMLFSKEIMTKVIKRRKEKSMLYYSYDLVTDVFFIVLTALHGFIFTSTLFALFISIKHISDDWEKSDDR